MFVQTAPRAGDVRLCCGTESTAHGAQINQRNAFRGDQINLLTGTGLGSVQQVNINDP